jgi:hypothetical protein
MLPSALKTAIHSLFVLTRIVWPLTRQVVSQTALDQSFDLLQKPGCRRTINYPVIEN